MNDKEEKKQQPQKDIKITNEQHDQYLAHLNKEINEFDKQIQSILGDDWETQVNTKTTQIAMNVRKCCKNKIYMEFIIQWFPSKVGYKQLAKEATSVYFLGWGAFMNEVITNETK